MPKTNPDIHIICGKCGCATMFEFKVVDSGEDAKPTVLLTCNNCSTLTGLDEVMPDKTDL